MAMHSEIIICVENAYPPQGNKPSTLREIETERLLDRRVLKWSAIGTYGMGGPGFFGILLEHKDQYHKEWLILTLWGSARWMVLDGRELRAQDDKDKTHNEPIFAVTSRLLGPLSILLLPVVAIGQFFRQIIRSNWDETWRKLVGSKIIDVTIGDNYSAIKFEKGSKVSILETPKHYPVFITDGNNKERASHLDAWIVSESGKIYC